MAKTMREIPAVLSNHTLYVVAGLPYITDALDADGSRQVIGDLLYLRPAVYARVLADLDRLEGYRSGDPTSHYVRVRRLVDYRDVTDHLQQVDAWVYHAGTPKLGMLTDACRVRSGDWLAYGSADSGTQL
jgi:gamma-glutamylcyclotransferase (GGCT)/AIG2-like uncharacterized protein YtfP